MSQVSFAFVPAPILTPAVPVASARGARLGRLAAGGRFSLRRHAVGRIVDPAEPAGDAVASRIGRDHARHGLTPPAQHLTHGHPVAAGWQAGRAAFGARTLHCGDAVRASLDLRLQAWLGGVPFDDDHVTPHLLERLQPAHCPITREALTPAGRPGSATRVERLRPDRGYEPGNLVLMGERAAQARDGLGFRDCIETLARLEAEREPIHRGLTAAGWGRLAVLESFALALPHDEAARLPLLVMPPPRVPVASPVQSLQVMLTAELTAPGYARRMSELSARIPAERVRQAFQIFLHTLLARRVALKDATGVPLRQGLEDAWRHPLVNQRWQRFALDMTPAGCERLVEFAVFGRNRPA